MGYRMGLFAVIAMLAAGLTGCTKDEVDDPVTPGSQAKGGEALTPPGMTPEQMEKAHSDPNASGEAIADLKKKHEATKAAYDASPKDEKLRKDYVEATVELGTATMMSDLPPREKYSAALKFYREALAIDPKNEEALTNKKMIEDIYKQMGRPVPE